MANLRLIKSPENPTPKQTLREQARDTEPDAIEAWLDRTVGNRAIALWAREVVGIDSENERLGEALALGQASVAGVFLGIREMQVRTPRAPERSGIGVLASRYVAVFSTSHGPADIPDDTRERMADNDITAATLYAQIGVSLDEKVAFGPLHEHKDDEEVSKPILYVVK